MLTRKFSRKEQYGYVKLGQKGCSSCGKVKKLTCFQKQNNKIGYRSNCKYCRHLKYSETPLTEEQFWWRDAKLKAKETDNRGRMRCFELDRVHYIKRYYEVSIDEARELYKKSINGLCSICYKSSEDNNKALAIDHCHRTGKIRGVLCDMCNKGIGHFKDNCSFLKNAIRYLDGH